VICELIVAGPSQPRPAAMWPALSPSTETASAGEEKGCGLLILANLDRCWGSHVGGEESCLGRLGFQPKSLVLGMGERQDDLKYAC
jgi:hypothetical protein